MLSGEADAENSLDIPENIHDRIVKLNGAGKNFVYKADSLSVNVLRLEKK